MRAGESGERLERNAPYNFINNNPFRACFAHVQIDSCCELGREVYLSREAYDILPNPPHTTTTEGIIPMYCDGYRLLMFHRGFKEEALKSLNATAKWRAEVQTNKIRSQTLPSLLGCTVKQFDTLYHAGLLGINKEGRPIIVRRFGMLDMKKLQKIFWGGNGGKAATEYFKEAHIWEMEVRPSEGSECSELPNVALYT